MNLSFKIAFFKPWTVTDNKLIVGNEEISFTDITKIDHKPSFGNAATIWIGNKFYTLGYSNSDREKANEAIAYIKEKQFSKEELDLIQTEFRMCCNVCGHIFCYKIDDVINNFENAKRAKNSAILGVVNAIGGTHIGTYANINQANRYMDKIIDFNRCPHCNSTDLEDITDGDISPNSTSNSGGTISVADELKKFKDLLDNGTITQEEFDAKKKQLLDL